MNKVIPLFFTALILTAEALSSDHFLTFIIPSYNCEEWIEQAVDSIFDQKLNCPFELICTNDASTDSTLAILKQLANKHPEMKVFDHPVNKGGAGARNTCVKHSKGDLIFCLDSDNVLVPDSVQKLIDEYDRTGCDIVCFETVRYFVDNFNQTGGVSYDTPNGRYKLKDMFTSSNCPPWSGNYLYTRKSFDEAGGYPENSGALDTFLFGFLKMANGCEAVYVPDTFYWHRHGIDSYYIRDMRSNKLTRNFFFFLNNYSYLFTDEANEIMQDQIQKLIFTGKTDHDLVWYLEKGLLTIRQ